MVRARSTRSLLCHDGLDRREAGGQGTLDAAARAVSAVGNRTRCSHLRSHTIEWPKTLSILVVEDHAAIRDAIARSLARRGCRVATATNGIEGLEAVRAERFDAVITDLNMPERGGLWLWEHALKLRPELRGRFVLISSEAHPGQQDMGLFLQSEHFLVRPFSLDGLLDQAEEIGRSGGDGPGALPPA